MADLWGALAQAAPAAGVLTDAYTCPALKHATIEVVICNRSSATTVRVAHAVAGAAAGLAQYLLYDFQMNGNDAMTTARFTVGAGDVVRVSSGSGLVTFNINGIEEDG